MVTLRTHAAQRKDGSKFRVPEARSIENAALRRQYKQVSRYEAVLTVGWNSIALSCGIDG